MAKIYRYAKSRGFTDRLYMLNFIMVWLFVWACFIATLFSGLLGVTDLSPLNTSIGCAFAELGLNTGFIIHKAKIENLSKHGKLDDASINVD